MPEALCAFLLIPHDKLVRPMLLQMQKLRPGEVLLQVIQPPCGRTTCLKLVV